MGGAVWHSLLGEGWTPRHTLAIVLRTLHELLQHPNAGASLRTPVLGSRKGGCVVASQTRDSSCSLYIAAVVTGRKQPAVTLYGPSPGRAFSADSPLDCAVASQYLHDHGMFEATARKWVAKYAS